MKIRTRKEFIEGATLNQLECRVLRHAWDVNKGQVISDGRDYKWVLPCLRSCGTRKVIRLRKRNGELVRSHYRWLPEYHVKGGLRKGDLARIRKVLLEEILGDNS